MVADIMLSGCYYSHYYKCVRKPAGCRAAVLSVVGGLRALLSAHCRFPRLGQDEAVTHSLGFFSPLCWPLVSSPSTQLPSRLSFILTVMRCSVFCQLRRRLVPDARLHSAPFMRRELH